MSPKVPESPIKEMLGVLLSIRNKIWNYHDGDCDNNDNCDDLDNDDDDDEEDDDDVEDDDDYDDDDDLESIANKANNWENLDGASKAAAVFLVWRRALPKMIIS